MGIRTNKVMTVLNIGLKTVVEYLKSKPGLEPTKELNLYSKLTDEQFEALISEFASDIRVKEIANTLLKKRRKKDKTATKPEANKPIDETLSNEDIMMGNTIDSVSKPTGEENLDKKEIVVPFSKLHFETNSISLKRDGAEFVLLETGLSRYLNSEKSNLNINNVSTRILLDYSIHTFKFIDKSLLPYLLDLSSRLENEKFEKHLKNVEKEQLKKRKEEVGETIKIVNPKIEYLIQFSALRFSHKKVSIIYKKRRYVYRDHNIKDYDTILEQIYSRASKARKNTIKTSLVKVVIDTETETFTFKDIDINKYVNNLKESFFPQNKKVEARNETTSKVKDVPQKSSSTTKTIKLDNGNIHFYNGYFLIFRTVNGVIDNSVNPYRVNDPDSHEILNLVHNYFEQRFEQMRIVVKHDDTKIYEPSKLDLFQLKNYVRALRRNLEVKGEWWEEVQNARKRTFGQCFGEPIDSVKSKYVKSKNEYLYNLSSLQNERKLIRVYEINHGKEEDAFIFTISMSNNRCAIVFENASNEASTTTWLFVAKNENYEDCVNMVFNYFTDYTILAKRSSLRKANTNPPFKFKAESYTFIDHNDLGQWLKKLDKVLERTSQTSNIVFVPGLNIPKNSGARTSHSDVIPTKNLHNQLQRKLYERLCDEHGKEHVGTEIRVGVKRIDTVVQGNGFYDIYEVKTATNPFDCVTEALGQLCQYAYLFCRDKIGKMVIVGASEANREVEQYLSWFRKKHMMEVYYMQVEV